MVVLRWMMGVALLYCVLLVFTGESQPQDPGQLYTLCNAFLDYAQKIGTVKKLYGAGGYLREQLTGAPRVCGVVNRPELKKALAKAPAFRTRVLMRLSIANRARLPSLVRYGFDR